MSELSDYRERRDVYFRSAHSPLTPTQRKTFTGLNYFGENPALRIGAPLSKYPNPERVQMATSTGHVTEFLKYASVRFEVNGTAQMLQIYK
ncbi:MAG: DUF1684 domain-containing protein, partial [Chloroflexi bacterium]|nr:DUF1684 domain-containing protein [Chloroflexota bacterium]